MLKKMFSLVLLISLASCNEPNKSAADGYTFGAKQYEMTTVQISVVTYRSRSEIVNEAKKYGQDIPNIVAFSVLRAPYDKCTIHMVDPSIAYEPEYIGHEFAHCVYGQWHRDNDSGF